MGHLFLNHRFQGPWESLARFTKQAREIELVGRNVTFYKGLPINMLPCLHTCCGSKIYFAIFVARAQTYSRIFGVKKKCSHFRIV